MKILIEQYILNGWVTLIEVELEENPTVEEADAIVSEFVEELANNKKGIITSKEYVVIVNCSNGPIRFTILNGVLNERNKRK